MEEIPAIAASVIGQNYVEQLDVAANARDDETPGRVLVTRPYVSISTVVREGEALKRWSSHVKR